MVQKAIKQILFMITEDSYNFHVNYGINFFWDIFNYVLISIILLLMDH